jgi:hypothetical protein
LASRRAITQDQLERLFTVALETAIDRIAIETANVFKRRRRVEISGFSPLPAADGIFEKVR